LSDERHVLIDKWFPLGEVSVESVRERSVGQNPAPNRLHVWFARRPLATSRAAILCSLLDDQTKREDVLRILGIPPDRDVKGAAELLERARAAGRRIKNPFEWERAYKHVPTEKELEWLHGELERIWGKIPVVLDPMAGGGSIPYEAVRLGLPTIAGDLNPVAYVILKATVEYPARFGEKLIPAVKAFCDRVHEAARKELEIYFPKGEGERVYAYLWARTVRCPHCRLLIPMSPNWWIVRGGERSKEVAVTLIVPKESEGCGCGFEVVTNPQAAGLDPEKGTDVSKDALCPRCGRVMDGDAVKAEAQAGRMGHQLYAVCTKKRMGRRSEWVFRTPTPEELEAVEKAEKKLKKNLPEWEKQGLVPTELYPENVSDTRPLQYGMPRWCDIFNSRQLLTHLTYLENFLVEKQRLLNNVEGKRLEETDFAEAVTVYGAIVFDCCIDYNSIFTRWDSTRNKIANTMSLQGFAFKTSYAEWNQIIPKAGYEWAVQKTIDSLKELVVFIPEKRNNIQIFSGDSAAIPLESGSLDCIIVDPPYHENVMYGEVSDFFYVWLKRTAGDFFPKAFKTELTDKQEEAIANPAMFRNSGGRGSAKALATQYYQSKMEACFRDMNRVLRDDGVLTVMFTHRKFEAWASLATAIINAGFTSRASWPVFTEPGQKFGKAEKGVLKVTVLLACRKRHGDRRGLWEQVIKELYDEAERKVKEHAAQGITGPDLLVSVYGPVLGKFADYSLVKDATGNIKMSKDALNIVADVVNKHHTADIPAADLDTLAYINLIREFPGLQAEYDLARLTTVFGGNITLDTLDVKGGKGLVEKKGSKVNILTAHQRQEKGIINPNKPEDLRTLIDVAHASIIAYEQRGLPAVTELLRQTGRDTAESGYIATLRAIAQAGTNNGAARPLATEARTISSLLEALGHRPEVTRQKGESLDDWVKL